MPKSDEVVCCAVGVAEEVEVQVFQHYLDTDDLPLGQYAVYAKQILCEYLEAPSGEVNFTWEGTEEDGFQYIDIDLTISGESARLFDSFSGKDILLVVTLCLDSDDLGESDGYFDDTFGV